MSDQALTVVETAVARTEPTLIEIIREMATDPRVDVEKLKGLMDLKERADARAAEAAFAISMKECQSEMVSVVRDAMNEHTRSKYARLETIDAQIRPVYTRHGFSLSFNSPQTDDSGVTVSCRASHEAGHSRDYQLSGSLDGVGAQGKANKTSIQALGSTVSYLRRYLTCMIFNVTLTNEDNDGNVGRAAAHITQEQVDNIECLIAELGMTPQNVSTFLLMMEAKSIREIRADRARQATIMLEVRRKMK
jgi:hypothetical protein